MKKLLLNFIILLNISIIFSAESIFDLAEWAETEETPNQVNSKNICKHCNKKFIQKSSLNRHMKSHSDIKPYQCQFCGKSYKLNYVLQTHIKIHTTPKSYNCPICNVNFRYKGHLKTHIQIVHDKKTKHQCPICEKYFAYPSHLKAHIEKHTEIMLIN